MVGQQNNARLQDVNTIENALGIVGCSRYGGEYDGQERVCLVVCASTRQANARDGVDLTFSITPGIARLGLRGDRWRGMQLLLRRRAGCHCATTKQGAAKRMLGPVCY